MSSFDIAVADVAGAEEISALLIDSDLGAWRPGDEDAEVMIARGEDGRLLGCAVLVSFGDVGLLRSVAVASATRGTGVGRALVEAVFEGPAVRRLASMYLLTTTAAGFFEQLGFRRIDRDRVDPVIKGTHQYQKECPDTAVVMRRVFDRPRP